VPTMMRTVLSLKSAALAERLNEKISAVARMEMHVPNFVLIDPPHAVLVY
jgi:hypothetical protein